MSGGGAGGAGGIGGSGLGGSGGTLQECSNGVLEGDEACDGAALGGATCTTLGFDAGTLGCTGDCTFDTSGCTRYERCGNGTDDDGDGLADCADDDCFDDIAACPRCGDGIVNRDEETCDGSTETSCTDLGFDVGTVTCSAACTFDTNACIRFENCSTPGDEDGDGAADCDDSDCVGADGCPFCGNGILEGDEACDGAVPPGISCATFGFNHGTVACSSGCRLDSSDCSLVEDCLTPGDEDGNGAADCEDLSCAGLGGCSPCGNGVLDPGEECDDANRVDHDGCQNSCMAGGVSIAPASLPGQPNNSTVLTAHIGGTGPYYQPPGPDCSPAATTAVPYDVLLVTNRLGFPASLHIWTLWTAAPSTGLQGSTAIYRLPFQPSAPLTNCIDSSSIYYANVNEPIDIAPDETIAIVPAGGSGNYRITVTTIAACGDGVRTANEACDDGNHISGDGCFACRLEPGWVCDGGGCRRTVCGDGTIEGDEECEDGNTSSGDGCSATCQAEGDACGDAFPLQTRWNPSTGAWTWRQQLQLLAPDYPTSCMPSGSNDAVASFTAPSPGRYEIDFSPASDLLEVWTGGCGPGAVFATCIDRNQSQETTVFQLDAGETIYLHLAGRTASATGQFTIAVAPVVCGDGFTHGDETCDDGNLISGDGCSSTCSIETVAEVEPNDDATTAIALPVPGIGTGSLSSEWDADFWSFDVTTTATLLIQTWTGPNRTCGSTPADDTALAIYDAAGTLLAQRNSGLTMSTLCAALYFSPPTSGTYYVEVGAAGGVAIPAYELTVDR